MNFEEEYEFPCGLKYHVKYSNGFFEFGRVHWDTKETVCPLHGKDCKR